MQHKARTNALVEKKTKETIKLNPERATKSKDTPNGNQGFKGKALLAENNGKWLFISLTESNHVSNYLSLACQSALFGLL